MPSTKMMPTEIKTWPVVHSVHACIDELNVYPGSQTAQRVSVCPSVQVPFWQALLLNGHWAKGCSEEAHE